jgi:dTDP-4-amino-4,6-dideoxygalactose transaminase
VFGGMVATNNQAIAAKLEKLQRDMPQPSRAWIARNLLHPLVFSWGKKSYNFFNLGKAVLALMKKIQFIPLAVSPAEKQGKEPRFINKKMPNALAILAKQQFDKLERFNQRRRKIAAIYDKELADLPRIILPKATDGHIYLRYTVRVANPWALIKKAQKQGIELGCWYDKPVAPHDVNQAKVFYQAGSCPTAELLAKESLNLPTNIQTSPSDALKITRFIKQNI